MNFGHSHPKIVEATVKELRNLHLVNTSYINPLYAQYADRMTKVGLSTGTVLLTRLTVTEIRLRLNMRNAKWWRSG